MTPFVPKPDRGAAKREGLFPKEAFTYDAENDAYRCPGGRTLKLKARSKEREMERRTYSGRCVCPGCPLKTQCTKSAYRQLTRYKNEAVLEQMAERLKARPGLQDIRRESAEHPFGSIKQ